MTDHRETAKDLIGRLQQHRLNRRRALLGAGAFGATAAAGRRSTSAQDATPGASPTAGGRIVLEVPTREEIDAEIRAEFNIVDPPADGGTFIWGAGADTATTNFILAADSPSLDILGLVFETVTSQSPVDGRPAPALADSWEVADDQLTYTFALNQQATWHDGTPFTSADVVFSMDAILDGDTGSSYTSSFADTVESYRAIDDHTLEVVSKGPQADFLIDFGIYAFVMPKHIWENVPHAEWAADPGSTGDDPSRVIGTGPFKFQEWDKSQKVVTLTRNDNWYGLPKPVIDSFIVRSFDDDNALLNSLVAGDIDLVEAILPANRETVESTEGLEIIQYNTFGFYWYAYNLDPSKTPLFQDVEVRQALLNALDRQSMVDDIFFGLGEVAQGSQPKLSPAYAPDRIETQYDFNPERAIELLESAGWVAGADGVREKDGVRLSWELIYPAGLPIYDQFTAYMQEAWSEVGAEMTPTPVDFDTVMNEAISETFDFEMAMLAFGWDITGNQSAMFNCDSYNGAGFNPMMYCNPAVDELNDRARVTLDREARIDLLIESANVVNEDVPVGIIMFRDRLTGYNTRAKNYNANGLGFLWSIPYVYIEE